MTINPWLLAALVFGICLLLALWRASARIRSSESARAAQESSAAELRKQLEERRIELETIRVKLEQEQGRRVAAETEVVNQRANLDEQRRLLEEAESNLKNAFDALALKALETSTRQFLDLAKTRFDALRQEASGELAQRQTAIEGLVNPLNSVLAQLQEELARVESSRKEAYGELKAQVQQLVQTGKELRLETGSLVTSLRQPQIKGRWGELTLRRAVELAGMSPHCDFNEQQVAETEDGRLRPDLVVHLPGGTQIVIDAKVPLHAFLKVVSARSDAEYQEAMGEHARLVRGHISQLSGKDYWKQFEPTPEFVVLFVPGESFFSAALEHDRTLIEDAIDKKVVLASPTTLIALLRAIAYGWRQEQVTKNAEQIRELGKELYERVVKFVEHMADLRVGLERATGAYNKAVGSLEGRLLSSARKFKTLGVAAAEEIPPLEPTEAAPRQLSITPSDDET